MREGRTTAFEHTLVCDSQAMTAGRAPELILCSSDNSRVRSKNSFSHLTVDVYIDLIRRLEANDERIVDRIVEGPRICFAVDSDLQSGFGGVCCRRSAF